MTTSENIEQPETAQPEQFDSVGADDSSVPEKNWFYAAGGQNQGAYSEQQMLNFITATIIAPTTSVWSGEGEWIAAKDSSLAHAFPKSPTDVPPPLKADDVDNRIIWLKLSSFTLSVAQPLPIIMTVWFVVTAPLTESVQVKGSY